MISSWISIDYCQKHSEYRGTVQMQVYINHEMLSIHYLKFIRLYFNKMDYNQLLKPSFWTGIQTRIEKVNKQNERIQYLWPAGMDFFSNFTYVFQIEFPSRLLTLLYIVILKKLQFVRLFSLGHFWLFVLLIQSFRHFEFDFIWSMVYGCIKIKNLFSLITLSHFNVSWNIAIIQLLDHNY